MTKYYKTWNLDNFDEIYYEIHDGDKMSQADVFISHIKNQLIKKEAEKIFKFYDVEETVECILNYDCAELNRYFPLRNFGIKAKAVGFDLDFINGIDEGDDSSTECNLEIHVSFYDIFEDRRYYSDSVVFSFTELEDRINFKNNFIKFLENSFKLFIEYNENIFIDFHYRFEPNIKIHRVPIEDIGNYDFYIEISEKEYKKKFIDETFK